VGARQTHLTQAPFRSQPRTTGRSYVRRKGGPPAMADKKTIYRSSVTGRIVKEQYAKTHPTTTEKERVNTK